SADDGNGCLSSLAVCTTYPAHSRGACAVASGYTLDPFRTHLAATPWHAYTHTTASDDWAEICRPVWGWSRHLPSVVRYPVPRAQGNTALRCGNAPTPLCYRCARSPGSSGVVHAGMPRLSCDARPGRHPPVHRKWGAGDLPLVPAGIDRHD